MVDTKKQRARKKYEEQHGSQPSDAALIAFMATLSASDYGGCSDTSSSTWDAGSSCDSSSSSSDSGGSSCGGSSCGGGG